MSESNESSESSESMNWAKGGAAPASLRKLLSAAAATPENDPEFFGKLQLMPNPDPLLRRMGRADEVYRSIMADAHVRGELRGMRGHFRSLKWRIIPGIEHDAQSVKAQQLCQQWLAKIKPNPMADWTEIMWQMSSSVLSGYRCHSLIWDNIGGAFLPTQLQDVPNRRVQFAPDGAAVLSTKSVPAGLRLEPYQMLVSRHEASVENPYGTALLSSCFWPWTFKTGGFRYFVKYCERHGLPMAIGKYPRGTGDAQIDALAEALHNMIEQNYVAIPDDDSVALLETKAGGSLPQQHLIDLCNREMSKAITAQAMVAETQGVGSRAANEVAHERQRRVHESDRDIAASSFGQVFRWITDFNFGEDVPAPKLEFYDEQSADKTRAETYQIAANMGAKPSRKALLDELDIPEATDEADALGAMPSAPAAPASAASKPVKLASADVGAVFNAQGRDAALDDMASADAMVQAAEAWADDAVFAPVMALMAQFEAEGKSMAEFNQALTTLLAGVDGAALQNISAQAHLLAALQGGAQAISTRLG